MRHRSPSFGSRSGVLHHSRPIRDLLAYELTELDRRVGERLESLREQSFAHIGKPTRFMTPRLTRSTLRQACLREQRACITSSANRVMGAKSFTVS
jgi:hypothetical protein